MKTKKNWIRLAKAFFCLVAIYFLLFLFDEYFSHHLLGVPSNLEIRNSIDTLEKNGFSVYTIPSSAAISVTVGLAKRSWLCRQDTKGITINTDDGRQAILVLQPVCFIWRNDKTFDDRLMEVIRNCTNLETVVVNCTDVSDASADILAELPNLKFLDLRDTQMTVKTLQIIADSQRNKKVSVTFTRYDDSEISDEIVELLERKKISINLVSPEFGCP